MVFDPWVVVVILVILVIVFGAGRLTHFSGAVGKSVREFRTAVQDDPKKVGAPAIPAPPPVLCPSCQTPNAATNRFCSVCGSAMSVAPQEITCPSCATAN